VSGPGTVEPFRRLGGGPGLEQQHAPPGVLGKPPGERAARRTAAHHDHVEHIREDAG
jgi:hypothetical protein